MAKIPHLAFPLNIRPSGAVTTEQDSVEEVEDCVEVILRFEKGSREEYPEFGITDQTFEEPEVDPALIHSEVLDIEPRLELEVSKPILGKLDQLTQNVRVERSV